VIRWGVTPQRIKLAVREDAVAIDLSDTDFWIAAGTCVAAVAAVFSAWFSRRSSQDAAKTAQATLFLSLQREYASDEMLEDLRKLRSWREQQGADFVSKWEEQWETNPETRSVNESRRRVSHFFGAIADLYRVGLLSEPLARALTPRDPAILLEIVEPLERQLNPNYNRSHFKTLRRLVLPKRHKFFMMGREKE
jgi:hypothetical protein